MENNVIMGINFDQGAWTIKYNRITNVSILFNSHPYAINAQNIVFSVNKLMVI